MNDIAARERFVLPGISELQLLLLCTGTLLVFGSVLIASASMDIAADIHGHPFYFAGRQVVYIALGCLTALVVANVPLAWWLRSGWLCLFGAIALLVVVLTPLGITVNGSTRWISLGFFNLQVSEFARVLLMIYLAGYVVRRREELIHTWAGFLKPVAVLTLASFLLITQPDFGATVVLMAAALGMIFLSGVKLARFAPLISLCAVVGALLVIFQPYRLKRVVAYLDPWQDQFDTGYQLTQALIAFGQGDWFGAGLGNSVQKLFYLPEAHTDFVFAIAAEEFGLIGALAIVLTYTVLVWMAFRIARNAEKAGMAFGACLAYGMALVLGLQAFINMAVNTGLLPTKGLTLPLVSYGGSSMIASCVAIALLARVEMERQDGNEYKESGHGR